MPKRLKVEFSPTALFELEDLADYIAPDTPIAAEQWVDKLMAAAQKVASHPRSGRAVPEVADPKIREVIVGAYRVVYRDVTLGMLEDARRKLRALIKLIDKQKRKPVYTNFEDELGAETLVSLQASRRPRASSGFARRPAPSCAITTTT